MLSLFNGLFLEACTIQPAWVNSDANSDITGDRIRLDDCDGVAIVIVKPAGTAGDDLTVDLDQHDAASSGNSKALSVQRFAYNLGGTGMDAAAGWVYAELDTASDTIDFGSLAATVRASQNSNVAVGAALTDLTTDSNAAVIVIDVKAGTLDANNGYKWLSINSEGDAIGNALTTNCLYIPYGRKYGGLAPRSVIA